MDILKNKTLAEYLNFGLKFALFLSILNAIYYEFWHIMSVNIFLLALLFLPHLLKKSYKIIFPSEFEILLFALIIISFFLKSMKGIVVPIFFGVAVGFAGFMIMLILYSNKKIKKDIFLIILFVFCLSLSFGTGLELLKYYLKLLLGQVIGVGLYSYSMMNLTFVAIGTFISCLVGFFYMVGAKGFFYNLVKKFKKENPEIFFKKGDVLEDVLEAVEKGENEFIEFKETLRVNTFTNQFDKKIEFSVLKTISAFLNSKGGMLLIGVSDKGEIKGIKRDMFETKDKLFLYLTNIIKRRVGESFLPFISLDFVGEDKQVLVVECIQSNKPVFLKTDEKEEFYIRIGPSSSKIEGRELIEYINKRFEKL